MFHYFDRTVSKILTFEGEEENAYQAAPSSQKLPFHKLDDALSKVLFFFLTNCLRYFGINILVLIISKCGALTTKLYDTYYFCSCI
jgi:hypothetical protein